MDNFVIYRLDNQKTFINYHFNGFYDNSGNEVRAGDYRVTENKSFKCYELVRNSGNFNVKNNEFSMNDDLKIIDISLKSFLTLENFDVKNTTEVKIIHVNFKSNKFVTLTIEINGLKQELNLDSDEILKKYNLLIKEDGIYKFKVNNIFLEIANTKEFKAKTKGKCSVLKNNTFLVVNLNDIFISIVRNKEYYEKSFNFSTDFAGRNHEKIIYYLKTKGYKNVLPLAPYNKANDSFEKPLTVLLLKNENKELEFFEDFLIEKTKIKNMTINKPSLTVKNCYTASDVVCNVIFTFEIREEVALDERYIDVTNLIVKENNKNIEVGKEYTLTFDLCFAGDSAKKFYSIFELADASNDYFLHVNDFLCEETPSSLKYTYNPEYDDYDASAFYLGFIKDYVLGLLVEKSEQDYKSGLRGLVSSFIKKYSVETKTQKQEQADVKFLDEDKFYNHITGGMPRVEVTFVRKNYEDKTNKLKAPTEYKYVTGLCPYIKSMSLTDNGVKKLKLVLWDRDFGSYNSSEKPLEQVIREAIAYNSCNPDASETEKKVIEKDSDVNDIGYLKIVKVNTSNDTTNLKLRFGFDDYNMESTVGGRTNRAWEIVKSEEGTNTTKIFNPYFKTAAGGKVINKPESNSENESYFTCVETPIGNPSVKNEGEQDKKNKNINRQVLVNKSEDQTTRLSLEMEFMIVGYKTSLQKNGIVYEIEAIESSSIKTLNYSILQRFEDITGTPSEVLYTLMRLFNENADGVLNRDAPKIYFDSDDIVEEVDKEAYRNSSITIPKEADINTINKKISISLGGQNSYYNYNETNGDEQHQRYYKNIGSLISEFCAACPPKKDAERVAKTYVDSATAETVTIENNSEGVLRPLQWYVSNDVEFNVEGKEPVKVPCIFLYYRRVNKINKIRRYNWGPGLAGKNSVVLDLQIENANEFAVMSAVSVFDLEEKSSTTYGSNGISTTDNKKDVSGEIVSRVTGGSITSGAYENAYNNCLYQGSITILGDPFYTFDNFLQPCSYPIYLNIEVPVSEYELRNKVENNIYFNKVNNNVRKHYLSGYYVIKAITHNITDGNFTTTLDIMSYPGIANDINIVKDNKVKS
jgi:hypothetical protein